MIKKRKEKVVSCTEFCIFIVCVRRPSEDPCVFWYFVPTNVLSAERFLSDSQPKESAVIPVTTRGLCSLFSTKHYCTVKKNTVHYN